VALLLSIQGLSLTRTNSGVIRAVGVPWRQW